MTIELTFGAARGASCRSPVPTGERHGRTLSAAKASQPAEDAAQIDRGMVAAQGWPGASRGLQLAEDVFAVVVCAGLLALGTMTFGYAFGGVATAQAAHAPAAAASR